MMRYLAISFLFTGAALAAPASFGETDDAEWRTQPFGIDIDRRGSAIDDYSVSGWRLDQTPATQPHIRFNCSQRAGLVAIISPTPEKLAEAGTRISAKVRKSKLSIEGRKPVMANWLHVRETGIMQSRENAVAKKVFNAVITQAPITIKLPLTSTTMTFNPPPPDVGFRTFMKECGLAN
ncbi:MAG: hypothetical protein AAFR51_05105 [Pseudomonadota bacterium]